MSNFDKLIQERRKFYTLHEQNDGAVGSNVVTPPPDPTKKDPNAPSTSVNSTNVPPAAPAQPGVPPAAPGQPAPEAQAPKTAMSEEQRAQVAKIMFDDNQLSPEDIVAIAQERMAKMKTMPAAQAPGVQPNA